MAILEMEWSPSKLFVVSLEMQMSGHLCRNSAMETSDTCGNCNGGNCDTCEEIYTVKVEKMVLAKVSGNDYDELKCIGWRNFEDKESAIEHYNFLCEKYHIKRNWPR